MVDNIYSAAGRATGSAADAVGAAAAGRQTAQHFSPSAVADRASARVAAEQSRQALSRLQATRPTQQDLAAMGELQSQELEQALNAARIANQQLAGQFTYSALDRFNSDGDLRHLNTMLEQLRRNPASQNLPGFSDIVSFQHFGPGDEDLLEPYGLTLENMQENPELGEFLIKAITTDGEQRVLPTDALFASTGYKNFATDRELNRQKARAEAFWRTQQRNNANTTAKERHAARIAATKRPEFYDEAEWVDGNPEYDMAYLDALNQLNEKTFAGTADERLAQENAMLHPAGEGVDDWGPGNPEFDRIYNEERRRIMSEGRETSAQRNIAGAEQAKATITNVARENNENFFDIDFQDNLSKRLEYEPYIQRIMALGNLDFSNEERRTASYVRELISLGESAGELTDRETGIIDRMFNSVRRYVTDNSSEGDALTSAYSSFRNTVRNAMFGSTLTAAEIRAHNEAFGNLGQQTAPVLRQFRTGLTQLRDRLDSLVNLNDSYVSHFYLGADVDKLQRVIDSIDERIELIDRTSGGAAGATEPPRMPGAGQTGPQFQNQPPVNTQQGLDDLYNSLFGGM